MDKSHDEASSSCLMMWLNVGGALVRDIPLWSARFFPPSAGVLPHLCC